MLLESESIVSEPQPKVVITNLAAEGICVTANFRINSNENRPLEAFDEAASRVLESLSDAGIELFPPASMIVQRSDQQSEKIEASYKKAGF